MRIHTKVVFHTLKLGRCEVVRLDCVREVRVQPLDLREDALDLRLLRRDRRWLCTGYRRGGESRDEDGD